MEELSSPCGACQNENANLRCSGCKCYYYCNKSCQKIMNECIRLARHLIDFNIKDKKMNVFIDKNKEASSEECCVCYELIDSNQLQLPCNHVFCVEYMLKVNTEFNAHFNVPYVDLRLMRLFTNICCQMLLCYVYQ